MLRLPIALSLIDGCARPVRADVHQSTPPLTGVHALASEPF